MSEDRKHDIITVLNSTNIAFLSTLGKMGPETSMTPFAIHQDNILIHLSQLAKHSKNIAANPRVSIMVCTPESSGVSPLALPRISLQGRATRVSEKNIAIAKATYLAKIPDAEPLFSFSDFELYQFDIHDVYWIGGFGSARKISLDTWSSWFC